MILSLVTEWMSGPGNCPLIKIPWKNKINPDYKIKSCKKNLKNLTKITLKNITKPVDEHQEDKYHHKWYSS